MWQPRIVFCNRPTILEKISYIALDTIAPVAVRKHHQQARWNYYIFFPTNLESAKMLLLLLLVVVVVLLVFLLPVRTHFIQAYFVWIACIYSKRSSVCYANWIALRVEGVYCMTELFENNFWPSKSGLCLKITFKDDFIWGKCPFSPRLVIFW